MFTKGLFTFGTAALTVYLAAPNGAIAQPSTAPSPTSSQAASNRQAEQVQLAVPFGTENGQLVISGQNLMFIDSQQPSGSFVVPRSNVRNTTAQAGDLTFDLVNPVQDRGGSTSRLVFRLANPEGAQQFVQWFHQTQGGSGEANRATEPGAANAQQPLMSFQVKHDHFIGSDSGRLMLTPTQLVYESVTNVNNSRQWNLSDIKEVHQDGPYKLKIVPFSGDDYSFELMGQGITSDQYQMLVDRVTSARVRH